jgi:hypothetical protein
MIHRAGSADLPLHGGRVPSWLGQRMTGLGAAIVEAIVFEYGRDELLRRLANPFWFQSFGAVMGMDWHSSGITTSVLGPLKRGQCPASAPSRTPVPNQQSVRRFEAKVYARRSAVREYHPGWDLSVPRPDDAIRLRAADDPMGVHLQKCRNNSTTTTIRTMSPTRLPPP